MTLTLSHGPLLALISPAGFLVEAHFSETPRTFDWHRVRVFAAVGAIYVAPVSVCAHVYLECASSTNHSAHPHAAFALLVQYFGSAVQHWTIRRVRSIPRTARTRTGGHRRANTHDF